MSVSWLKIINQEINILASGAFELLISNWNDFDFWKTKGLQKLLYSKILKLVNQTRFL